MPTLRMMSDFSTSGSAVSAAVVTRIWHQSLEPDAGHQWFRNHLIDFCRRL